MPAYAPGMKNSLLGLALTLLVAACSSPASPGSSSTAPSRPAADALEDAVTHLRAGREIGAVTTATGDGAITSRIRVASDGSYAVLSSRTRSGDRRIESVVIDKTEWFQAPLQSGCWTQNHNDFPGWTADETNAATSVLNRMETPRWVGDDVEFETPASILVAFYPAVGPAFSSPTIGKKSARLKVRAEIEGGVLRRISADSAALAEIASVAGIADPSILSTLRGGSIEIAYEQLAGRTPPAAPTGAQLCRS